MATTSRLTQAEQPHQCATCGRIHYVPSLARDCETRHQKEQNQP